MLFGHAHSHVWSKQLINQGFDRKILRSEGNILTHSLVLFDLLRQRSVEFMRLPDRDVVISDLKIRVSTHPCAAHFHSFQTGMWVPQSETRSSIGLEIFLQSIPLDLCFLAWVAINLVTTSLHKNFECAGPGLNWWSCSLGHWFRSSSHMG